MSDLILVDGMAQNGGASLAADSCGADGLTAGAAAARYFGLDDAAALIDEFPAAASDRDCDCDCDCDEDAQERLTDAYDDLMLDDRLDAALAARYAVAPEDFEPV